MACWPAAESLGDSVAPGPIGAGAARQVLAALDRRQFAVRIIEIARHAAPLKEHHRRGRRQLGVKAF